MIVRPAFRSPEVLVQLVVLEIMGLLTIPMGTTPELLRQPWQLVGKAALIFAFNVLPVMFCRNARIFVDELCFGHIGMLGRTKTWPVSEFLETRRNLFDVVFIGNSGILFKLSRTLWGEDTLASYAREVGDRRDSHRPTR